MSFLKAEWRRLALANYEIDPALLKDYVPYGTELDQWNGTNYVSLVGFLFKNTRMLGFKIPFHINFEEVNLRFYVRYKERGEWKRGVVFVKEIVPKAAITFVANTLYREHYQTLPMRHHWEDLPDKKITRYEWKHQGEWQSFELTSSPDARPMKEGSEIEFITEHYWGYTQIGPKKTYEYEVRHPRWEGYEVTDYTIKTDYGRLYGDRFAVLNQMTPKSVMLAEGSEISVEGKRRI
ncbi:MAG: DUF2071 domain-containing protein [Bacteroidetes bacterium]|nr:DUF2071 domain-containing protein [Bacteroidota bacterium]